MGKRTNSAVWNEKQKRWRINVQKEGVRKTFYSSVPGRNGQREANSKADAWLDDGIYGGSQRVKDLWTQFAHRQLTAISETTYDQIVYVGDNYVIPLIGHLKISDVTEGHLQMVLDVAFKKGSQKKNLKQRKPQNLPLSKKTVSTIKAVETAFIKYCRVSLKVTSLFPESLQVPKSARLKGKTVLQPDALSVLLNTDTTILRNKRVFDNYIYAYRFQVICGLRPGELVGLRVGDVRPDGTVMIYRSLNVKGQETRGKNDGALRSFVTPPQALEAYRSQLGLLRSWGVPLNLNTPLFQITCQHTYYGRWSRYLESNGLSHISPYELRHTFVSIAKYLPEGQVKPLVGHSQNMDTYGQYGHLLTGEAERTAKELGSIFDSVLESNSVSASDEIPSVVKSVVKA